MGNAHAGHHRQPYDDHPSGWKGGDKKEEEGGKSNGKSPRLKSIKASGRRAQKLQSYSSLTFSTLKSPSDEGGDTATTATTATTAATATAAAGTTAPTPTTATTAGEATATGNTATRLGSNAAADDGEDEMALVKSFLSQQSLAKVPEEASYAEKQHEGEQEEALMDMCLLCEREFRVGSKAFYVLELCGHGYCVECLYQHLQRELSKMNSPSEGKGKEKEVEAEAEEEAQGKEEEEKGKGKETEEEEEEEAAGKEKEVASDVAEKPPATKPKMEINCPLASCNCVVSLEDLKKGLAVFTDGDAGASLRPLSSVPAALSSSHALKRNQLPSALSVSLRIFIESNESFVMCPNQACGVAYERLQPTEAEKTAPVQDEEGKPVLGVALAHYHEYRFRCRVCDTIFCSSCKTIPYHLGYTCQQYQQFGSFKHCIICNMPVKKDALSKSGKGKEKLDQDADKNEEPQEWGDKLDESLHLGPLFDSHYMHGIRDSSGEEKAQEKAEAEIEQKEEKAQEEEVAVEQNDENAQQIAQAGIEQKEEEAQEVVNNPEEFPGAPPIQAEPDNEQRQEEKAQEAEVAVEQKDENAQQKEEEAPKIIRLQVLGKHKSRHSDSSVSSCSSASSSDTESADGEPPPPPPPGPPGVQAQAPEDSDEELNYEEFYGFDVVEPAPIQAFNKEIPRLPRGIFVWRKRRVLRIREAMQAEKETWDKSERERYQKEYQEYCEKKEAHKRLMGERIAERKEIEEYILENEWCGEADCRKAIKRRCLRRKDCGHYCNGIALEQECLHCLDSECIEADKQTADDFCNICWVEGLGAKPCIALTGCGHIFHYDCVKKKLKERWPTAVISFSFMDCPLCNKRMDHPGIRKQLKPLIELEQYIQKAAVERIAVEGLAQDKALTSEHSPYYGRPEQFAMDTFAFYLCFLCRSPYYGGRKECANLGGPPGAGERGGGFNPEELVCGSCSNLDGHSCKRHGEEYVEWKCRFCCRTATYFCGGKAHFCTPCHDVPGERVTFKDWATLPTYLATAPKCSGVATCPLRINHPPNGLKEFCLGCALCRAEQHDRFNL